MTKIIKAINSMIINKDKISNVKKGDLNRFFFIYEGRYVWSIRKDTGGEFFLRFYPAESVEHAMRNNNESIRYSTSQFNSKEDVQSFEALHMLVQEKIYGLDKALDDIINSGGA